MRRRVIALIGSAIMAMGVMSFAHAHVGVADKYIGSDGVWSETNGLEGLQRTASDDGTPADTHDLAL